MSPWRRSVVRASWICLVGSTLFLFKTNTQTIPQLLPWEAGGSVKVKSDHHIVSKSSSSEKWWPLRAQESSIKAFPRWGGEGIAIQAILSYLEFASTKPDTPRDLLYPNDYPMPNVVYVIGSIEIFQQNNNKSNIALWVERHRRQLANLHDRKIRFEKVERLLKDALQYLTSGKHKHKHKHHHKYQRLYEATTRGGIP